MEYVGPGDPRWDEARRASAAAAVVELPNWPVFGPAGQLAASFVGEWSRRNGELVALQVCLGRPSQGPALTVQNQVERFAGLPSLDWLLARRCMDAGVTYPVEGALPRASGRGMPETPRARTLVIKVDGIDHDAAVQEAGEFVAARTVIGQVVVTIMGSSVPVGALDIQSVTDISVLQSKPPPLDLPPIRARQWENDADWVHPPDRTQVLWAHRGLVDMVLRSRDESRRADGLNRPHPRLDPDWGLRWAATHAQQQGLAKQSEPDARAAVGLMVNEIGFLADRAEWWSQPRLRERAINQILWYTAKADETLSSAAAQRLWQRKPDIGDGDVLAAWKSWVRQGQRPG